MKTFCTLTLKDDKYIDKNSPLYINFKPYKQLHVTKLLSNFAVIDIQDIKNNNVENNLTFLLDKNQASELRDYLNNLLED